MISWRLLVSQLTTLPPVDVEVVIDVPGTAYSNQDTAAMVADYVFLPYVIKSANY